MKAFKLRLMKRKIAQSGGTYLRTKTANFPDGKEREIIIYSGDNYILGRCYAFTRVIMIHECVLRDKMLFKFVLSHEFGHLKHWWFRLISILPREFLFVWGLFLFAYSLIFLIVGIIGLSLSALLLSLLGLLVSGFLGFMLVSLSWISELSAEFAAIREIGFQNYLKLPLKPDHESKWDYTTHPSRRITIRLWRWSHRNCAEI